MQMVWVCGVWMNELLTAAWGPVHWMLPTHAGAGGLSDDGVAQVSFFKQKMIQRHLHANTLAY